MHGLDLKDNPLKCKTAAIFIGHFYKHYPERDRDTDMGQVKATVFLGEYLDVFQLTELANGQTAGLETCLHG